MDTSTPILPAEAPSINLDKLALEVSQLPLTNDKRIILELGIRLVKDMICSQPDEQSSIRLVTAFGIEPIQNTVTDGKTENPCFAYKAAA